MDDHLHHDFTILAGTLRPHMERAFRRNGQKVYRQFKVGAEVLHVVDHRAIAYARDRAAKLITSLSDTTRQKVHDKVVQALEERWGAPRLANELRDSEAFSPARALNIARTELQQAWREGGFAAAKAAEAQQKFWSASVDSCPMCQDNEEQGWIDIDDEFTYGSSPHPSCSCPILYRQRPIEAEEAEAD